MSRVEEDVYRPCPCGSGRRYKFCCRERVRAQQREVLAQAPTTVRPDGKEVLLLDLEAGERLHEQGLNLVVRGHGREAVPILERAIATVPLIPNPYNNLALAHFLCGDPEKAIEVAERVDRVIDPGNTFALASLVHYYMIVGRAGDAENTCDRLRTCRPESDDAAVRVCEAFARLGRHRAVLESPCPASGGISLLPRIAFLRGTAAANLGDYALAREYLQQAARNPSHRKRATRYLGLVDHRRGPETVRGDWPYFTAPEWVSSECLERLQTERHLRSYPGVVFALVEVLNDDPAGGELTVRALGEIGSPQAIDVLRQVAHGTFGTDELRFTALTVLRHLGAIKGKEQVQIWHSGDWKTVALEEVEITEDAVDPLPPELETLTAEVLEAIHLGDHVRAERGGRALVAKAPDAPSSLQNLAAALHGQGKLEDAEAQLRRAMEIDPQYLFAPASLAEIRLQQNRVAEARDILAAVVLPPRVHPDAYAAFLSAHANVALAEGNTEAAAVAHKALESLPGDRPARGAQDGFAARLLRGFQSFLAAHRQRAVEKRLRLLAPDASVRACLADYSRDQLGDLAAALELAKGVQSLRKPLLLEQIAARLCEPGRVLALAGSLPEPARAALQEVLGRGGVMSWADFTRKHGTDTVDKGRRVPETPLGRLKVRGLVAEGTVGGQESVIVPAEVRKALRPPGWTVPDSRDGGQETNR